MTNDRRNARNGKGPSPNYRGQNHRGQNYRGPAPQHRGPQPAIKAPPAPVKAPAHPPRPVVGVPTQGVLELHPKGYGFLRNPARFYAAQPSDAYVPAPLIQRFALREGLLVAGPAEDARRGTTGPRLLGVDHIEGAAPSLFNRRDFDELTPIDPDQRIVLETGAEPLTTRVMDLLTPIGKGQRGLIVAPPRTGKTVLLQHIAHAVSENHPEMDLIVLLVDERPEEVTEIRRTVRGQVIASSNDRDTANHVR